VDICLPRRPPHISVPVSCLSQPALTTMPKRTEQKLIVCSGKSEAEVTNNKDCGQGIVLLKLTTDRHEASCGLSARTELLLNRS